MSLKVFQLAKELGINSKLLVKRLQDEGIPKIDTHMSQVSIGLAETIRGWHKDGTLASLVESSAHMPTKSKSKKSSKAKAAAGPVDEDHGDTAVAVEEPPVEETSAPEVVETVVVHAPEPEAAPEVAPHKERHAAPVAEPVETPAVEAVVEAPAVPAVEAVAEPEAVVEPEPAVKAEAAAPVAPVAPVSTIKTGDQVAAAAHKVEIPQKPVKPPVAARGMVNVPTRPVNIAPVGPRVVPTPAQMQGPKVIRVEQPDNLPAPRARPRPQMGGQGGQGTSGGPTRSAGGSGGSAGAPGAFPPSAPTSGASSRRSSGARGPSASSIEDEESKAAKRLKAGAARRHGGRSADAGVAAIREWTDADLAEREERLNNPVRIRRKAIKATQRPQMQHGVAQKPDHIEIMPPVTIRELAEAMGIKSSDLVRKLMEQGVMATVNQTLDGDTAQTLALEFDVEVTIKERETGSATLEREYKEKEETAEKVGRPPVVTILGHVDHGKTSLLDKIRSANVAAGEAGGITQHVGAYTVTMQGSDGKDKTVTFLDTPGHQAFTAMRARGANVTDVVVLVVAADDGVMPQTIESIAHAKAAGVPIVVAMNKIDKPEANANKVLGQLAEQGLNPTEWGGDTEVVRTSATTGQGIKELIEYLDYVATLRELKASPTLDARGTVIESFMDPLRGVIARVLVQNGTLKIGDTVVCGPAYGRVRTIVDDKGKVTRQAGPSAPVELVGLDAVPAAGDKFFVVQDTSLAAKLAEERTQTDRNAEIAQRSKVTLENLFAEIKKGDVKELRMILKTDVQGSMDVLKTMMTEELSKEVKVRLLHAAVGGISESDVLLAEASNAIIVGFSVVPDDAARKLAEAGGVEIRLYRIIYEITDDIRKALTGMLAPSKQDQTLGHAEIRQVIKVSRVGNIAGVMVSDGVLQRNCKYRLIRDGAVVQENLTLESLKRFKEDVKEVRSGLECGIKLAGYDDIKLGDRVEAYKTVDVARTL